MQYEIRNLDKFFFFWRDKKLNTIKNFYSNNCLFDVIISLFLFWLFMDDNKFKKTDLHSFYEHTQSLSIFFCLFKIMYEDVETINNPWNCCSSLYNGDDNGAIIIKNKSIIKFLDDSQYEAVNCRICVSRIYKRLNLVFNMIDLS